MLRNAPIAGIIVALFALASCEGPDARHQDVHILFIGNSYTFQHDVPNQVAQVNRIKDGIRIKYQTAMIADGGANLIDYVDDPRLMQKLEDRDWDVIVLQDRSMAAFFQRERIEFDQALLWFRTRAREEKAALILFETWPRRDGHEVYDASPAQGFKPPRSQKEMLNMLQQTYKRGAARHGAMVATVGTCWLQAENINRLYAADGSHASKAGAALSARVIERTISGQVTVC